MSLPLEIVERIQQLAQSSQKFEAQRQRDFAATNRRDNNEKQLDETLRKLQDQVDKQDIVLQQVGTVDC